MGDKTFGFISTTDDSFRFEVIGGLAQRNHLRMTISPVSKHGFGTGPLAQRLRETGDVRISNMTDQGIDV